jgi:hypothetical protein
MADESTWGIAGLMSGLAVVLREGLGLIYRAIKRNGETAVEIAARQEEEREKVELIAELRKVREELNEAKVAAAAHTGAQNERDDRVMEKLEALERQMHKATKRGYRHSNLIGRLFDKAGMKVEREPDDEQDSRDTQRVAPIKG